MPNEIWTEDWEVALVNAAKAGDLRSFDILARRYRPAALAITRHVLKCRDRAEDVAQDALLAAYAALPKLQEPERFAAWFGTIVRNRALRVRQGEARTNLPLNEVLFAYTPALTEHLDAQSQATDLHHAISQLPSELATVVELYYLDDWPVKPIAEFLALPITTVKWRLHTARRQLRALLSHFEDSYEREI